MLHLIPTKAQWRRWSLPSKLTCIGVYVSILSVILSVVFYVLSTPTVPTEETLGLTPAVRSVVDEILRSAESKQSSDRHAFADDLAAGPTEALKRDPYNVRALILRGQGYYSGAKMFGALRFREALSDFEKASEIDATLADPHFGIGTVLYQVALFDLADRGLYKIHQRGEMRFDPEKAAVAILSPSWEFFIDTRNRMVLQAALDEFQVGRRLHQLYSQGEGGTITFFAPQDVESRIRSIRTLLGYEPLLQSDIELVMHFTSFLSAIEPGGLEKALSFGVDQKGSDNKDTTVSDGAPQKR